MIDCPYCQRRHKTYNAVAKCKFPRAYDVSGDGPWGSLAFCRGVLTICLCPTRKEAEDAKAFIDRTQCGHDCVNDHRVWFFGPLNSSRKT